jgi:hypothetical protein
LNKLNKLSSSLYAQAIPVIEIASEFEILQDADKLTEYKII